MGNAIHMRSRVYGIGDQYSQHQLLVLVLQSSVHSLVSDSFTVAEAYALMLSAELC